MVRSLLGLLGALLMLSQELLMGIPEGLSDLLVTDPGVERVLAFTMEQYNRLRYNSTNYFKVLRVLRAQSQGENGKVREYYLKMELVKTTCEKKVIWKLSDEGIQRCTETNLQLKRYTPLSAELCNLLLYLISEGPFLLRLRILQCNL